MFTTILTAVGAAIGPLARMLADFMDGENSADMVAAKKAAANQTSKDAITGDVAKGDLKAIGKDIS